MEFDSQVSVTGLPVESTTIVGMPVAVMAFMRGAWAPTRARLFTSTCSPVLLAVRVRSRCSEYLLSFAGTHVAFRPAQSSFWSLDQVPTTTMATSDFLAAAMASVKPDSSLLQGSQP